MEDIAMTPADDGSDFYSTPVASGTPVKQQEMTESLVNSTPVESKPVIPGLSFLTNPPNEQHERESALQPAANAHRTSNQDTTITDLSYSIPRSPTSLEAQLEVVDGEQAQRAVLNTTTDLPSHETHQDGQNGEREAGNPEWEVDSSPIESSSDSSSDNSSDSSEESDDDEDEGYPILSAEETARILMQAEGGSDDEGDARGRGGSSHIQTANEQAEEILPIPNITITPDMKITLLGKVETIVENIVLVKATTSGEYQVLESSSLLCLEDRTVIGVVSETLGRVEEPLYAVRYSDNAKITDLKLSPGKPIFYVDSHSIFVFTQPLKGLKGSDASNLHDEEIGEEEIEFSDDEAEAEYKRRLKQKRKEKRGGGLHSSVPGRSGRAAPGPSRLGQNELNYDDGHGQADSTEDGYTPLVRPKNYSEMMTSHQGGPADTTSHSYRGSYRGSRGRGSGVDRGSGRGGRGRGRGRGSWESSRPRENGSYGIFRAQSSPDYQSRMENAPPPNHPSDASYETSQPPSSYSSYSQQPQQQSQYNQYSQQNTQIMPQIPFQAPQQQQTFSQFPAGAHINPAFFTALQQAQQQHQPQPSQQYAQQPHQSVPIHHQQQPPPQISQATFEQVKAQLDLLRRLSAGGGPNPTGGPPQ